MRNIFIALFLIPQVVFAIYGQDDRIDLHQVKSPMLKKLAQAVAYQVDKNELRGWTFNRYWKFRQRPLNQRLVCSSERFAEHSAIRAGCTGVLVGEDLLLTAGNCITEHYCWNDLYYWAFNYSFTESGTVLDKLHKNNFYKCDKVVKRYFSPSQGISFALLKLKKKVRGIEPVKISSKDIDSSTKLVAMGHPKGIPLKIATNVSVLDQDENLFITNSDIGGSNKGVPLFDESTGELMGMSIYGTPNFYDFGKGCKENPVFKDNEGQELFIKSKTIKAMLSE
jgi:V8-like Glu-specific endopeptidase